MAGEILDLTAEELQQALNATRVSAVSFDRKPGTVCSHAYPQSDNALPHSLCPTRHYSPGCASRTASSSPKDAKAEPDLLPLIGFLGRECECTACSAPDRRAGAERPAVRSNYRFQEASL